jgi:hypothetical protein
MSYTVAMSAAVAERVDRVVKGLDLSPADIAEIVGASSRSVRRWMAGDAEPQRQALQRLLELTTVMTALAGVIRPDDAHLWLFTPNRLLDYATPAALLANGEWRRVIALIEALADGVFLWDVAGGVQRAAGVAAGSAMERQRVSASSPPPPRRRRCPRAVQ